MGTFVVEGGHRLEGRIRPAGNKNAALALSRSRRPLFGAGFLRERPTHSGRLTFLMIIEALGAEVTWSGDNEVTIDAGGVRTDSRRSGHGPSYQSLRAARGAAARAIRTRGATLHPGGDVIGRRRMDTHFLAFEALGAELILHHGFEIKAERLLGADFFLDEPSVTGTENAIMAAVRAEGATTIRNAAAEPHVQDLCHLLNSMGAQISGIGTHKLTIEGVKDLHGTHFRIGADHIETGSFIGLAAVTASDITSRGRPSSTSTRR